LKGYWTRFFPVYDQLRDDIKSGKIGEPLVVQASFGFKMMAIDRTTKKDLGGGALLDIGCYTVQLAEMVFGKPESVTAVSTMQPSGR